MIEILLITTILLLVVVIALLIVLLRQGADSDLSPLRHRFDSLEKSHDRIERSLRNDIAKNREEASLNARQGREEMSNRLKDSGDSLQTRMTDIAGLQKNQLDIFAQQLARLTESNEQKLGAMRETVEQRLGLLQDDNGKKLDQMREEASANARQTREEMSNTLKAFGDSLQAQMANTAGLQKDQLEIFSERLEKLTESNDQKLHVMRETIEQRLGLLQDDNGKKLDQMREEAKVNARQQRDEVTASLKNFNDSVLKAMSDIATLQKGQLETFAAQLGKLTASNENKLEMLRNTVNERLQHIQEDNAKQLDQMRATVDEKLQGTLEKRLGESFKQVSERLEQVHKGLGEMQTLATGVGDLKRVLTNVKTRGGWGEIQLEALLEQILTPEQYERNVKTNESSDEMVEFAIKLPGRGDGDGEVVWLPIDAKFPIEDYQRLIEAQEQADPEAAEMAAKMLTVRIKSCAKDICDKYLCPPKTTDFGIMFLPTEGLYAEVARRIGLIEIIQREYRVVIAGPTTFAALLNSLQMGFRTMAIQQRSSEVWRLLGAVKTEFGKFGGILEGVKKKLHQASNTLDEAARRSRAIERKLQNVQELPAGETQMLLVGNNGETELGEA